MKTSGQVIANFETYWIARLGFEQTTLDQLDFAQENVLNCLVVFTQMIVVNLIIIFIIETLNN